MNTPGGRNRPNRSCDRIAVPVAAEEESPFDRVMHDDTAPAQPPGTPDGPDDAHRPPEGVSDDLVEAVGKVTAALEVVEQARGMLYGVHRLTGRADNDLLEALDQLEALGQEDLAGRIRDDLFGRNVLEHRWTFQIVEDYDATYWSVFRGFDERARTELADGDRHVFEARMKQRERTAGHPRHEAGPALEE